MRLWVRLSLLIGGLVLLVSLLQGAAFAAHLVLERQLLAGHPDSEISMSLADLSYQLVGLLAAVAVGGGGAAIFASRIISAPVARLVDAARRIGAGDLETRVSIRGSQEFEELALAFNTMAADLHHAEMLRRHMMADVSHELRTPLAALEGNLRAAIDQIYPLDDAGIARLYGQTRHLSRLVNDLRELALAEAGQLPLRPQLLDLGELLDDVAQVFAPLADEHGVQLTIAYHAAPHVEADAARLRQMLDNLLSNALRHTPAGGTITLSAEPYGAQVRLAVRDTGEGLTPEQQRAVFDRFYRADLSRNRATGGSGLGLAIVKALVEAHGGTVAVSSLGRDQGSLFTLDLPIIAPHDHAHSSSATPRPPAHH